MTTLLQQAKELKEELIKREDQMKMMINVLYEKTYEFSEYNNIIRKIKALKAKIKAEGGGETIRVFDYPKGIPIPYCHPDIMLCQDCKQAIKELEDILK